MKMLSFRCPDELESAIVEYGKERFPYATPRGGVDYDRSATVKEILLAGIEALTSKRVRLEPETDVEKLANKFEERISRLEELLAKK